MDVVGRKVVKTRAAHVCFGCGRKFEQGAMMERIAMDIERYGDVKVVSIVSDRGREEQLRMKGAKL